MGLLRLLRKLFKKPDEENPLERRPDEENPLEERIKTLRSYLSNKEITVMEHQGPSLEFVQYCSRNNLSCCLYEKTTFGTKAQLARKELKEIYHAADNMRIRALAGMSLGIRPIEILKYHKEESLRVKSALQFMDLHPFSQTYISSRNSPIDYNSKSLI